MTKDDFGNAAAATMSAGLTALATAAGTALGGPAGAIVFGSLAEGAKAWLGAIAAGNDVALREARIAGLEEQFGALVDRLNRIENELGAEGKEPDRTDPISREQTFSDFARDVVAAHSSEKREALVNAAASLHDPRRGSAASRAHWYDLVRSLPDVVVLLLRTLEKHNLLRMIPEGSIAEMPHGTPIEIPHDDAIALYDAAILAADREGALDLVALRHVSDVVDVELNPRGRMLLAYIG